MPDLRIWSSKEISKLKEDMDRMFDDFCTDFALSSTRQSLADGIVIREQGDTMIVEIEIPSGMDSDSVQLQVAERHLQVLGTMEFQTPAGRERTSFRRELRLPCRIVPDAVTAVFTQGVLKIEMPRCGCPSAQIVRIERR